MEGKDNSLKSSRDAEKKTKIELLIKQKLT